MTRQSHDSTAMTAQHNHPSYAVVSELSGHLEKEPLHYVHSMVNKGHDTLQWRTHPDIYEESSTVVTACSCGSGSSLCLHDFVISLESDSSERSRNSQDRINRWLNESLEDTPWTSLFETDVAATENARAEMIEVIEEILSLTPDQSYENNSQDTG